MAKIINSCTTSYKITLFQGVTYARSLQYLNSDGTPVNLTGKIVKFKVKDIFTSLLTLSSDSAPNTYLSQVAITNAAQGQFQIKLTDEQTATAEIGAEGRWWIELHDAGDVNILWRDDIEVIDV